MSTQSFTVEFTSFQTQSFIVEFVMINTSWMQHGIGSWINDNMIGCAATISVSALYSRCYILALSLYYITQFASCTIDYFLMAHSYI